MSAEDARKDFQILRMPKNKDAIIKMERAWEFVSDQKQM